PAARPPASRPPAFRPPSRHPEAPSSPTPLLSSPSPGRPVLVVAPDLAEEIAWRAVLRAERAGRPDARLRHHERAARAYAVPPGRIRDRLFARLAADEVEEFRLLDPVRTALAERPALGEALDVVLLARAPSPAGETVTGDRARRRAGIRAIAERFDDPAALLAWARHALGHLEDTLDPAFGFDPGWERWADGASAERLHALWDASVDGRAARAGRPVFGSSADGCRRRLVALLPPGSDAVAADLVDRCWRGDRPDFATLRAWAEGRYPTTVAPGSAPGGRPDGSLLPAGRCPLCRFPSSVLHVPDPPTASTIAEAHPGWRPELGVCERCHDRYRLVPPPRPRLVPAAGQETPIESGGPR
ncbi:MAG TPA: hypothetical protein VNO86_05935, partial [Candidatus Binatia bacterium]|nr:hypothetical protein [Candidatus Binatia bacterium]